MVISNQQCVGKGIISEEELMDIDSRMKSSIKDAGGEIAASFYCMHRKEEECACRKPATGLFDLAVRDLGIEDLSEFYIIGDSERDIAAGKSAGVKTILVLSGKTTPEKAGELKCAPDLVCEDLYDAMERITME